MSNQNRYIAYIRKSEEREDRQMLSVSAQRAEIQKHFPDLNIIEFIEESRSAFKPYNRLLFQRALDSIKAGEADGFVGWHPNRLSRNEIEAAEVTYLLRTGVMKDLKFCSFNFDNSAEGIMMLQMVMSQSQYESSKQGRDVKRGMQQKVSLMKERPGQVPQGYRKVPIIDDTGSPLIRPKDGKVITKTDIDPERFDLIRKMWDMLAAGRHTVSEIRAIANNDWQFTTRRTAKIGGRPLTTSMMYKIFNNVFYAGLISHNGEVYPGNQRPMVTLEEFDYVQKLLGDKGKPRSRGDDLAYASIMVCGECGCSIVGECKEKMVKRTGRLTTYIYYRCTRKSDVRPCNQNKYTTLKELEEQIESELGKYTIMPEFRDLALKVIRRNNKTETRNRSQIYVSQAKRRTELQSQLDKLIDMRTRELIDDDEYMEQKNRLKLERHRVDELLRTTEDRADEWMELTEKAFDFATYAQAQFRETSDLKVKRDILLTLGTKLLLKDKILTVEPNEWLVPIGEQYPALEKRYLWARTNQKASSQIKEEAMESIFETWRARWDSNPRHAA